MTNNQNEKYSNYFDDEENTPAVMNEMKDFQSHESVDDLQSKPRNKKNSDFMKPDPPSVSRKIVKDVRELEEMQLEELYSQPFTNSKLSPIDHSNLNYEEIEEEIYKKYPGMDVELYDEEYIDNASELTIEEKIKILENKFEENKHNFDTLHKLIYLYKLKKDSGKLKWMREYTHNLFPLTDTMWKEWIQDELLNAKDFDSKYSIIHSHIDKSLTDFHCKFKCLLRFDNL